MLLKIRSEIDKNYIFCLQKIRETGCSKMPWDWRFGIGIGDCDIGRGSDRSLAISLSMSKKQSMCEACVFIV